LHGYCGASTEISKLNASYQLENFWSLKLGTLAVKDWIENNSLKENIDIIKSRYQKELT
jgi:hypothetical protein